MTQSMMNKFERILAKAATQKFDTDQLVLAAKCEPHIMNLSCKDHLRPWRWRK